MKYNPKIHHRRSIRLKGYDYSKAGAYFITICCHKWKHRFGFVKNDEMILNEYGQIAYNEWVELPGRFLNFELDVFQIMPNHMHGIIVLTDVGAQFTHAPTIGDIVGAYKSLVANKCLEIFKSKNETMGKLWHRNYYERIIRDEQAYKNISNYIINNPSKWKGDKFYRL